eukprot:7440-Rhodomonas_salina.3
MSGFETDVSGARSLMACGAACPYAPATRCPVLAWGMVVAVGYCRRVCWDQACPMNCPDGGCGGTYEPS